MMNHHTQLFLAAGIGRGDVGSPNVLFTWPYRTGLQFSRPLSSFSICASFLSTSTAPKARLTNLTQGNHRFILALGKCEMFSRRGPKVIYRVFPFFSKCVLCSQLPVSSSKPRMYPQLMGFIHFKVGLAFVIAKRSRKHLQPPGPSGIVAFPSCRTSAHIYVSF